MAGARPGALLIGDITHVKDEWRSLSPSLDLQVCLAAKCPEWTQLLTTLCCRNMGLEPEQNSLLIARPESMTISKQSAEAMIQQRYLTMKALYNGFGY
jgi:hypothetical protein